MKRGIRELWESIDRKNNGDANGQNRKTAIKEFGNRFSKLLEDKKLSWGDVSFPALYDGLVRSQDLEEAIDSSAFPNLTATLITTRVLAGYNAVPDLVDQLTTTVQSTSGEVLAQGFGPMSDLYEVKEREEYKELSFGEKQVKVRTAKHGGLISISEEALKKDTTGTILAEANKIGERAKRFRNKQVLRAVADLDANVYGGAALYPTDDSNKNYVSGADTTVSDLGWGAVDLKLGQQVDENGDPIDVQSVKPIMMVPQALKTTAIKLKTAEYGQFGTGNLDPNPAREQFDVVVNPYMTSALEWLYGIFKAQFVYAEVWPIQTFSRTGQATEEGFYKDIVQVVKVRLKGGIGAVDTRFVIKSKGAA